MAREVFSHFGPTHASAASCKDQWGVPLSLSRMPADTRFGVFELGMNYREGTGNVAYDTSGIDPSADLTLSGNVTWAGGWGITVGTGGKAQANHRLELQTVHAPSRRPVSSPWRRGWRRRCVAADNSYMVS